MILQSIKIFEASTVLFYLSYYAYICIGSIIVPKTIVSGHPEPKRGPQLKYGINGFRLTILTLFLAIAFGGIVPKMPICLFYLPSLVDSFVPLLIFVNVFTFCVSCLLYLKGALGKSFLGEYVDKHTHGSFLQDFWIGKQLNPRLGSFDIKFTAYRVAMIFWLLINLSFLGKQIQLFGAPTWRMACYQIMTGWYVLDYFYNEKKMLTTWDIISEEFGHMLAFGDYVFIPFVFSIQCHYLVEYEDFDMPVVAVGILALNFFGYYIFRTANSQKDQFKTQPNKPIGGEKPRTIGKRLLISGFWGKGRHINYTGDLIMALAYCLPCGLQLGGYTYLIYLTLLLTHRAYRDDRKCYQKYGETWDEYVKAVPYVFIPMPLDHILQLLGKLLYSLTNFKDSRHKTKPL